MLSKILLHLQLLPGKGKDSWDEIVCFFLSFFLSLALGYTQPLAEGLHIKIHSCKNSLSNRLTVAIWTSSQCFKHLQLQVSPSWTQPSNNLIFSLSKQDTSSQTLETVLGSSHVSASVSNPRAGIGLPCLEFIHCSATSFSHLLFKSFPQSLKAFSVDPQLVSPFPCCLLPILHTISKCSFENIHLNYVSLLIKLQ